MKTFSAKAAEVERKWHVIDADGQVLGQVAVEAARLLRGKHKPIYTPHVDTGDFVVVINAERVRLTGRKIDQKVYYNYSGYPGGVRERRIRDVLADTPGDPIRLAVKRMLPKTKLGRHMLGKLKIYAGPNHPHEAQQPQPLTLS